MERVFAKVDKTDSCWNWNGAKVQGYGMLAVGRKRIKVHRIVYEAMKSKIPEGLVPDHLCRNRACVNPEHIELVTNKENILRGIGACATNAQKTHCPRGHPLVEENLVKYRSEKGGRECKTCAYENGKIHKQRYRENHKEQIRTYNQEYYQKLIARGKN